MSLKSGKLTYLLLLIIATQYGCATIEQTPKTAKEMVEAPVHITEKIVNIKKMPELPKEFFNLAKSPVDLARSFTDFGWKEQFSAVGDRRGKGYSSNGIRALSSGDFSQAIADFQLASQREPKNTSYLTLLAWSYFKANQFDDALLTFEQIKELDPSIIDAYTGPGWVNFKIGKFDEAIKHFEEALTKNRGSSDAFAGLGWCYFRKNEIPLAKIYLEIALRKGMKNYSGTEPEAHRALGYLYFSQGSFKKAMNHFKIAEHDMPGWNDVRVKWGDCLFALGKYPQSIALYRYALFHEKTAEIYDKLGWGYFYAQPCKIFGSRQKNMERARSMFNRALAIDSGYASSKAGLEAINNKINILK